jgi:hypothetical protein
MKILILITNYFAWMLISIVLGVVFMRIEIGKPIEATGFLILFEWLENYIIFYIGGFIGLLSFIPFVLIDLFYIKKKIETKRNQNIMRILIVVVLNVISRVIHHLLEYTLDWI